ncbi:hypothetical protein N0B31_13945 [Salinirubellus salinus]|uniref:Uncharacterized protein n=1 Tax=Salinirubellus salinus TaxID=1364945 RepID=A0A9E7U9V5_9EURY|nr:hypothetical protein [Salinirubellus salinus]UWM53239.1 hypothetical protein N0B31_13945 [Salinirubellus salinus]
MAGLTDRDLRRIKRFVETPPRRRTPHILTPDEDETEGRPADATGGPDLPSEEGDADADVDVEAAG